MLCPCIRMDDVWVGCRDMTINRRLRNTKSAHTINPITKWEMTISLKSSHMPGSDGYANIYNTVLWKNTMEDRLYHSILNGRYNEVGNICHGIIVWKSNQRRVCFLPHCILRKLRAIFYLSTHILITIGACISFVYMPSGFLVAAAPRMSIHMSTFMSITISVSFNLKKKNIFRFSGPRSTISAPFPR